MSTSPIRVLVVDGEPMVLRALARQLERHGAHAVPAPSVRDALALLREGPRPDLVLTELDLPDGDGVAVLRAVRGDDGLAAIPVVAMSSSPTEQPFDLYLEKPFAPGELRGVLLLASGGAGHPCGRSLRLLPPLDRRNGPARRIPRLMAAQLVRAIVDAALAASAA